MESHQMKENSLDLAEGLLRLATRKLISQLEDSSPYYVKAKVARQIKNVLGNQAVYNLEYLMPVVISLFSRPEVYRVIVPNLKVRTRFVEDNSQILTLDYSHQVIDIPNNPQLGRRRFDLRMNTAQHEVQISLSDNAKKSDVINRESYRKWELIHDVLRRALIDTAEISLMNIMNYFLGRESEDTSSLDLFNNIDLIKYSYLLVSLTSVLENNLKKLEIVYRQNQMNFNFVTKTDVMLGKRGYMMEIKVRKHVADSQAIQYSFVVYNVKDRDKHLMGGSMKRNGNGSYIVESIKVGAFDWYVMDEEYIKYALKILELFNDSAVAK